MTFIQSFFEEAFELFLRTLSAVGKITDAAKHVSVVVSIQNLVEDDDPLQPLADKAKQTWLHLFEEKSRCQFQEKESTIVSTDITFTICKQGERLFVKIESEYLKEKEVQDDFHQVLKEFIEETNEFLEFEFLTNPKQLKPRIRRINTNQ